MKFLYTLSIFACCSFPGYTQPVKAYKDLDSYRSNTYTIMDSIGIREKKHLGYIIRSEYPKPDRQKNVILSNRLLNKKIDKCWAIERNDSLFINIGILFKLTKYNRRKVTGENYRPKGYEYVTFSSSKYLCFQGGLSNIPGIQRGNHSIEQGYAIGSAGGGVAGGIAGILIAGMTNDQAPERFNYLFDITRNKTIYFNRGVMRAYIAKASPKEDAAFISYVTGLINMEAGEK